MLAVVLWIASAVPTGNICSQNASIGEAVVQAINLTFPGMEKIRDAAKHKDFAFACDELAKYYKEGNSSAWLRMPTVKPGGTALAGGTVDMMVLHDVFTMETGSPGGDKIPRNADGGLWWTW